jgi:hypothetical protein
MAVGSIEDVFPRGPRQQGGELVTAHSSDWVAVAHVVLKNLGHMTQNFVAGGVFVGVVDRLESVHLHAH